MKPSIFLSLASIAITIGVIASHSVGQPLPPGAAGPFTFPSTNWTGFTITTTNLEYNPVQMDYTTPEGVHITSGVKKTITLTPYELGLRGDGVVVSRKVGP